VEILENLQLTGTTCLVGLARDEVDANKTVYLSARNIRGVEVSPTTLFNAYEVLRPKRLLLTRAALEELRKAGK
jgi:large subunit ribosomal protein L4